MKVKDIIEKNENTKIILRGALVEDPQWQIEYYKGDLKSIPKKYHNLKVKYQELSLKEKYPVPIIVFEEPIKDN